jgi:hypothetical protein
MPVCELSTRMSSSEMTEWAAYLRIKNAEMDKAAKSQQPPSTPTRRR